MERLRYSWRRKSTEMCWQMWIRPRWSRSILLTKRSMRPCLLTSSSSQLKPNSIYRYTRKHWPRLKRSLKMINKKLSWASGNKLRKPRLSICAKNANSTKRWSIKKRLKRNLLRKKKNRKSKRRWMRMKMKKKSRRMITKDRIPWFLSSQNPPPMS